MSDQEPLRTARVYHEISEIPEADWNSCANPPGFEYNPFIDHRFLRALEESKSAVAATGWQPFHVRVEEGSQTLGVLPMYLKNHSRGEYVFDGSWADAWYRAGGEYYPKLQVSVPFTPATGRRLLVADGELTQQVERLLLGAATKIAAQIGVSSLHITFLTEKEWDNAGSLGLLQRVDTQFHWNNKGYDTFDEFLSDLSYKKRKNIRRERRGAVENGIEIERITGSDLREAHWDAFYEFYLDTGYRKWGTPYLTREFFSRISESMPDQVLLVLCRRDGKYIAGAVNFVGSDTLFGRNWGCIEDHRFLHFEVCYYQAIEHAIERGLDTVEAGAQGAHKISRGYMPKQTFSAHWIGNQSFRDAVQQFLDSERKYVEADIEWVEAHTPFRQADVTFDDYKSLVKSG